MRRTTPIFLVVILSLGACSLVLNFDDGNRDASADVTIVDERDAEYSDGGTTDVGVDAPENTERDASADSASDTGIDSGEIVDSGNSDSSADPCALCALPRCAPEHAEFTSGSVSLSDETPLTFVAICATPCSVRPAECSDEELESVGGGPPFRWRRPFTPESGVCYAVGLETGDSADAGRTIVSECALLSDE